MQFKKQLFHKLEYTLLLTIATLLIFWCLAPFLWVIISSFKLPVDLIKLPPLLPKNPTLDNYKELFSGRPFHQYIINSLIVASATTIFCLTVGSFGACALSRFPIKGRIFILVGILSISMFPEISIVSSLYLVLSKLGWLNSYQGLIFPYASFAMPLSLWIMTSFFNSIPKELEDAAIMDGASPFQSVIRVIFPLAAPGMFTTAILVFIAAWNEFLFALTFTSTIDYQTVPVGISNLPVMFQVPWGTISAASVVVTVPLILVVFIFQKRIVEGLTAGAVKG